MEAVPSILKTVFRKLSGSKDFRQHMEAYAEREQDFGSELTMRLAAIGASPQARQILDSDLTDYWAQRTSVAQVQPALTGLTADVLYGTSGNPVPELIIGAGYHAAVYASARVAAGFPKPVVLESGTPGGAFAMTRTPGFWLNSDNPPGLPGTPGRRQALNALPGGPVQPWHVDGREFTDNTVMRYVIRCALAMHAEVITGREVDGLYPVYRGEGASSVTTVNGRSIYARRIIDARGCGTPDTLGTEPDGNIIQVFPQFMARMDTRWPLQGITRPAVIGGGNSGMNVIEAMMGIGPHGDGMDYIRDVTDWYARDLPASRGLWRASQRGRYSRIGSYLGRQPGEVPRPARVRVIQENAETITRIPGGVLVNGRAYSHVIICAGNTRTPLGYGPGDGSVYKGGIARKLSDRDYWFIGPAAALPFNDQDRADGTDLQDANKVAMFRLGPRTAALASSLQAPS
jgi:hypothetical protein